MRMFASDRVASIMERLKWPDDEPIEAKMVSRAVENAQKQIEELNYERRKNVLKYDEVMNGQREVIYAERRKILEGQDLKEQCSGLRRGGRATTSSPRGARPTSTPRTGTARACSRRSARSSRSRAALQDIEREAEDAGARGALRRRGARARTSRRRSRSAPRSCASSSAMVLLNITDTKWREHLYEMDYLQEGIHLRAYAQRDPLTEYRREAFDMFEALTQSIRDDFVKYIYRVELVRQDQRRSRAAARPAGPGEPDRGRVGRRRRRRGGRIERRRGRGGGDGRQARDQPAAGLQRQGAPQRAVPVRQRPEVQEVPRRDGVSQERYVSRKHDCTSES